MNLFDIVYALKNDQFKAIRDNGLIPFMGACLENIDKSQSQNYQDVWALYQNDFNKYCYFVEFGATDGKTGSNTWLLEKKYGWFGIVAEPNSDWHEALKKERSCNISEKCVYTTTGDFVDFVATESPELSTIKGFGTNDEFARVREQGKTVSVETITLYDLLNEYCAPDTIDYLSVDTEGTEYEILSQFFQDNDKYRVTNVSIEHNNTTMRELLHGLMTKNGYIRVFTEISRWDDFYTLKGN